jgi:hypothetical protein
MQWSASKWRTNGRGYAPEQLTPIRADALEVADQQDARVDARRNRRAANVVMVIRYAGLPDRAVEVHFGLTAILEISGFPG